MTTPQHVADEVATERWSALGGVLLSALYLWVLVWLLLAVVVPAVGLGWQPVVITSGSMQPLIRPGDVVLSTVTDEVEPGQVVTYEDPARAGSLTTHRILSVAEDGSLRTQGDANRQPDSTLVPQENLVGRGRLLVPLIGLPLLWLSSGAVLFGLWAVVTAISVSVVATATGRRPTGPPTDATTPPGASRRWLRPVEVVRPRTVQRAVVGLLVRWTRRLHDVVYRGYRPNPTRARRGAPGIAVVALTVGLARTPAAIVIGVVGLVLVVLFDPDGPQFRIGLWERRARRVGHLVAALVPSALGGRGLMAVVLLVAVAGSAAGRSAATFSAAAETSGSRFTAAAAFPTDDLTLYLQNEPEGQDTTSSAVLPMTGDVPVQSGLPNYDTDRDAAAGLVVKKGGADQFDTDTTKVQRWAHTPSEDLTLAGAQLVWHSAMKAFAPSRAAEVDWYLRHCAAGGLDCVDIATASLVDADWQAGSSGFVERTTAFGSLSAVVPAGRTLELVVVVPKADDDLWFAYDTAAQPSRLELVAATPGVCPGTGSSLQFAAADTRVEQDAPTSNFSTAKELDVVADTTKNRRSLLRVALPVIPDGCTLTGATLHLTTVTSKAGRTIVAQRTDAAFDAATVTWATQPTASGAVGSGPSGANGPTPIDVIGPVQELYSLGNTGLQLRDSAEGASSNNANRFTSLEGKAYPDPTRPRLEVTWGP